MDKWIALLLLTTSYVFGEVGHFLIGVTSRDVARDIGYGDSACLAMPNRTLVSKGNPSCSQATTEPE